MNSATITFLFIFLLTTPTLAFAHEGAHEDKNKSTLHVEEASVPNNSIYVVDNDKDTKPSIINDDPLGVSLSNSDILSNKDSLAIVSIGEGEPMVRFKGEINPQQHSQHEKQTVEKATHQFVSPQAKGHKVALGITIITGLAFLGLSLFKIGEGNNKNHL